MKSDIAVCDDVICIFVVAIVLVFVKYSRHQRMLQIKC